MKTKIVLLVLSVALAWRASAAVSVEGDWQGTLNTGSGELRLVLHIAKLGTAGYHASLDSIDQGANGLPITSISFKDSKLNFAADSIRGSYEGKISADGAAITGSWTQGQSMPLDFKRATGPVKNEHKPAPPSDIDGAWAGTIDTGTATLRIIFHITNTADGLTATLDSPDQGANGIPVTVVTRTGSSLKLELKQINGGFEGKIAKDFTSIEGTWSQNGGSTPLVLTKN